MLRSERRSLIRFLVIYLLSTFVLFASAAWIYYQSSKKHILSRQYDALSYEARDIKSTLRKLHQSDAEVLYYPQKEGIQSAVYDLNRRYIFGTFHHPKDFKEATQKSETNLTLVEPIEPYYLGAAYLVVQKEVDTNPFETLRRHILLFMGVAGVFFLLLGIVLGRLFIAPMRHAIEQTNRFIQDTTHELNTPVSTILTNIEMIEAFDKCRDAKEELGRIEIATRTLSRIYDDLTYLKLHHAYYRRIEAVDMTALVRERLHYFSGVTEAKRIVLAAHIAPEVVVSFDRNDAVRLIDNLLSNALKYNRIGGTLTVTLTKRLLRIEDTGRGMRQEDIRRVTARFKRADDAEGGFGIGLDIVSRIVNDYGLKWRIDSVPKQGTAVTIYWERKGEADA